MGTEIAPQCLFGAPLTVEKKQGLKMHTYFYHFTIIPACMLFCATKWGCFQVRTFAYTSVDLLWDVSNTTKRLLTGYKSGSVKCNFIFVLN